MRIIYLILILLTYGYCQDTINPVDESDDPDLDMDQDTADTPTATEPDITPGGDETIKETVKTTYSPPKLPEDNAHFYETFDDQALYRKRWIHSQATKDGAEANIAKYDGKWEVEEPSDSKLTGDMSLVLKSKAHHHAIAAQLDKPYYFTGRPFILQYEVRFKNGMECGGAYVKLLTKQNSPNLNVFHDKTPYTIMFGPDKCGNDYKLHFILRHQNPVNHEIEEKHAKKPSGSLESYFTDKKTHLYKLVVAPDNSFTIYVDDTIVNSGNLLKDLEPPINPEKEIDDASDSKPKDWDDRPKIVDPHAVKPDDWDEDAPEKIEDVDAVKPEGWLDDEKELVPDPNAEKPSDWDDDMDGEWEAPLINNVKCKEGPGCGEWKRPMIKNPAYKGKWAAPVIDNPDYHGIWKPRKIPNPNYFEDLNPYKMTPIYAIGLELWSMTEDIVFDNFLITDSSRVAEEWTTETWVPKSRQEKAGSTSGQSVVGAVLEATEQRPWLWAVIIVVIVLPIVLIIAYCCFGGSKADTEITHKKTDDDAADDVADDEGENVKQDGDETTAPVINDDGDGPNTTRSDLEAIDEKTEEKEDNENENDESKGSSGDSPRHSVRKRAARKD